MSLPIFGVVRLTRSDETQFPIGVGPGFVRGLGKECRGSETASWPCVESVPTYATAGRRQRIRPCTCSAGAQSHNYVDACRCSMSGPRLWANENTAAMIGPRRVGAPRPLPSDRFRCACHQLFWRSYRCRFFEGIIGRLSRIRWPSQRGLQHLRRFSISARHAPVRPAQATGHAV